jgi:coatomer subunit beta'
VHPSEHAELFEEGWEEALAREAGGPVDVNGDSGKLCLGSGGRLYMCQ